MLKKIGLLYSLSGTISIVGEGQLQASLLAIEEINRSCTLTFEPIIRDARSEPKVAALEAYNMFKESKIDVLVGCYMSSVRNSVLPVLYETGGLLLYPTLYEGEQTHPNIFYLGAVPNQQVDPMLSWALNNLANDFVLVGSDYVYPRATNRKVRQWVENAGCNICMEEYFHLGCSQFAEFFTKLNKLRQSVPSFVIFSTLVGTSVVDFYKQYRNHNFSLPIISPITSERETRVMGNEISFGHICTSAYFQTLDTQMNARFVNAFKQRFGDQPISREMASSYEAIQMLAMAYERLPQMAAREDETQNVRSVLKNLSFEGIQGKVMMDPKTQHLWQWSRIGRVAADGKINAFWTSPGPVPPQHDYHYPCLAVIDKENHHKSRHFSKLIGKNKAFLECIRIAETAAMTSSNVLITGETGTGKELMARAIHRASPRRKNPFIAVNCASIPRELIASEFFGYEEGSFTGAKKSGKPGKFELADGGTLFLDEIGEMSTELQVFLLRVIEEKELYRLGGTQPVTFDVRLISSTNKDLHEAMSPTGSFRRDLFYRLSVFHIHLPDLSDRSEDIQLLAEHFLKHLNVKNAWCKTIDPDAMETLKRYLWPGNIRELANVIESAFYLSQRSSVIHAENLPEHVTGFQATTEKNNKFLLIPINMRAENHRDLQRPPSRQMKDPPYHFMGARQFDCQRISSMQDNEKLLVINALKKSGYNISRAAGLLGISRGTLYRKIKKYKIVTK